MFYETEECLDTLSQHGESKPQPKIDTCNENKSNSGDQNLIQLCCHDESINMDTMDTDLVSKESMGWKMTDQDLIDGINDHLLSNEEDTNIVKTPCCKLKEDAVVEKAVNQSLII